MSKGISPSQIDRFSEEDVKYLFQSFGDVVPVLKGNKEETLEGIDLALSVKGGTTYRSSASSILYLTILSVEDSAQESFIFFKTGSRQVTVRFYSSVRYFGDIDEKKALPADTNYMLRIRNGVMEFVALSESVASSVSAYECVFAGAGKDAVKLYSGDLSQLNSVSVKNANGTRTSLGAVSEYAFGDTDEHTVFVSFKNNAVPPEDAFRDCTALKHITIPEGCIAIPARFCKGCTGLDGDRDNISVEYKNKTILSHIASVKFVGYSVEYIGESAFEGAFTDSYTDKTKDFDDNIIQSTKKLLNAYVLNIPAVKRIGKRAFANTPISFINQYNASSIVEIDDEAFMGSSLRCFVLGTSVLYSALRKIGNRAFYGCPIKEIAIHGKVEKIGYEAFYGHEITKATMTFGSGLVFDKEHSGIRAFATTFTTSETGVEVNYQSNAGIPEGFFEGWQSLSKAEVYGRVGKRAFAECVNLTFCGINDVVEAISNEAFYGCTSLSVVTIPTNLVLVGDRAFMKTSLETAPLYNSTRLRHIGENAFAGTKLGGLLDIKNTVKYVGKGAFSNIAEGDESMSLAWHAPIKIGEGVFRNNTKLTSLDLGKASAIGGYAFYGCTNIVETFAGLNIVEIGDSAFEGCSSMHSYSSGVDYKTLRELVDDEDNIVTISSEFDHSAATKVIGNSAFAGCTLLRDIAIESERLETIGSDAFDGCPGDMRLYCRTKHQDVIDNSGNDFFYQYYISAIE